jgi:hypothetical protein
LFRELEKEGLLVCKFVSNRAYSVQLTNEGKNIPLSELKLSDKEELILLIQTVDKIEKLFHNPEGEVKSNGEIHDVREYQEWIQQVTMYLQDVFDRTHDKFVYDSINICKKRMNGINDRNLFTEIVGRLKSIEINIEKYYTQNNTESGESTVKPVKKSPLIFISHSSQDKAHVELIVKLLKDMGFGQDKVFCSSIPGYGIKLNEDIYYKLLSLFNEHDLYVIFVHSPNYYGSAVGLNEMGAAWVLKTSFCSFLLPGFDYSEMKGVVD